MGFLNQQPRNGHLFTGICFLTLAVGVTAEWTINSPVKPLATVEFRFPKSEDCLPDPDKLTVVALAAAEACSSSSSKNDPAKPDVSTGETDLLTPDKQPSFDSQLFQRIEFATGCFASEIHDSLDSLTGQRPGKSHTVLLLALPAKTRESILLRGTAPIMSPGQLAQASKIIQSHEHHYADLLRRRNLILERDHGLPGIHELILFNDLAIFLVNREIKTTIFESILDENQRMTAVQSWKNKSSQILQ